MSGENKEEGTVSPVNEETITPVNQGIFISITQNQLSLLEEPLFEHVREKAKNWLSGPKLPLGREMDSVYFNEDRFELMIDTRGYKPEDVKCTVGPNTVEVVAQRQDVSTSAQRCMATSRSYQLPQNVLPQQAVCCLSTEGILLIAVPWQK